MFSIFVRGYANKLTANTGVIVRYFFIFICKIKTLMTFILQVKLKQPITPTIQATTNRHRGTYITSLS